MGRSEELLNQCTSIFIIIILLMEHIFGYPGTTSALQMSKQFSGLTIENIHVDGLRFNCNETSSGSLYNV